MSLKLLGRHLISRHINQCLNPSSLQTIRRFLHKSPVVGSAAIGGAGGGSYEGDGKTTVTIINKDMTGYLLVDTYSSQGFRLSNDMFAYGPIALFPSTVLQWDIRSAEDIDERSLSLFTIIEPRLELLVIGVGDDNETNRSSTELNRRLRKILTQKKINCEILPTKHAVSTYNYLCVDHRVCAGAFIPPMNPDIDYMVDTWLSSASTRFLPSDGKVFE